VFQEQHLNPNFSNLLWTVGGVGLPEELAKAAPVILFMLFTRHRYLQPRMYMFVGAVSGLVFGACEAVSYSTFYAQAGQYLQLTDLGPMTIWRLVTDGLFHACFTAIAAFFIGLAAWRRDRMFQLIAIGVATSAVLHGLYDRWSGGWSGLFFAVIAVGLFLGYVRSGDRIAVDLTNSATRPVPSESHS
jgi:RsiW-degrading membrane proteinase PrsW (M82 family)